MNRKLLILVLALLIVGLIALPLASAQFGGGDADNNDDSTDSDTSDDGSNTDSTDDSDSTSDTDSKDSSDSTEDSDSTTSDEGSTDDSNYDGGNAENNENETSDTDDSSTSDNETSYDGGNAENNENETTYEGGDAENNENETNFEGGDAENNENETSTDGTDSDTEDRSDNTGSGPGDESEGEDGSGEEESPPESTDPDSGEDSDDDGGGFSPTNYIIEAISQRSLQAEVNPKTIQIGERATVSGSLDADDLSNKRIEVTVNGQEYTTFTDEEGKFEEEISPTTIGSKEINVRMDDLEETLSLKVTPTVEIISMYTSLDAKSGESIKVCANVESQTDAELTLYHNDKKHNSKNGRGEICFNTILVNGENHFLAVATVEGDQDRKEISRETRNIRQASSSTGTSTGRFYSSEGAIIAGIVIILIIAGLIAANRRGMIS